MSHQHYLPTNWSLILLPPSFLSNSLLPTTLLKKAFIALLLCCSFSASALTLEQLQQQLMTQQILRGEFTQSKRLKMFKQPLRASGEFLLSHQKGLVWKQITPFPVSLILAEDKLRQQFAGQTAEIIQASDNPMVFYFSHLFLSLFKGDLKALESQFEIHLNEKKQLDSWSLQLMPSQAPLNKVFKNIYITGKKQIEVLTLVELNGDSSTIQFSNLTTQPPSLSQQENDAFIF